jgi:hypothetical protein
MLVEYLTIPNLNLMESSWIKMKVELGKTCGRAKVSRVAVVVFVNSAIKLLYYIDICREDIKCNTVY